MTVPVKKQAPWRTRAISIAIVLVILTGGGFLGIQALNNQSSSSENSSNHSQMLTAAYQAIVLHQPDAEYNLRDSLSQPRWSLQAGCAFTAQGLVVTNPDQSSTPTICMGNNGLSDQRTVNLLVQVTMSIQGGMCGALAVSDQEFEATLCTDGTTLQCHSQPNSHNSGECDTIRTDAIHQGLNKENKLALEVVAGQSNQFLLITFINGQYVVEQTYYQDSLFIISASIFLETARFSDTSDNTLYTDVQVWQVSNPVS